MCGLHLTVGDLERFLVRSLRIVYNGFEESKQIIIHFRERTGDNESRWGLTTKTPYLVLCRQRPPRPSSESSRPSFSSRTPSTRDCWLWVLKICPIIAATQIKEEEKS